jgi:hypothetical protein
MIDYTVSVPEDVYRRAREIAETTDQSVEQVLTEHLKAFASPMLPPDEEAELAAIKHLSDDALWTIAREQLPDEVQAHMQFLVERNTSGELTTDEYAELSGLVERGQRLTLRKSEAAAVLTHRGYRFRLVYR